MESATNSQPLARELEDAVSSAVSTHVVHPVSVQFDSFAKVLSGYTQLDPLVVFTDSGVLQRFLSTGGQKLLADRRLHNLSPQSWGRTLYLFARRAQLDALQADPAVARSAAFYWPAGSHGDRRVEVQGILRDLGFPNVDASPVQFASGLAEAVSAGKSTFAVVVDDRPSVFVDRFMSQLKGGAYVPLPPRGVSLPVGPRRVGAVQYELGSHADERFYVSADLEPVPPKPGAPTPDFLVLAVRDDDEPPSIPVILTNVSQPGLLPDGAALDRKLRQSMAGGALLGLFRSEIARCGPQSASNALLYSRLLMSAYLAKRDDRVRAMSALGHILLTEPKPTGLDTSAAVMSDLLTRTDQFPGVESAKLGSWLGIKNKTRYDFSNSVGAKYEEAVQLIDDAFTLRGTKRRENLTHARDILGAAVIAQPPAECARRGERGLNQRPIDYEPYFYLAVVDILLKPVAP